MSPLLTNMASIEEGPPVQIWAYRTRILDHVHLAALASRLICHFT